MNLEDQAKHDLFDFDEFDVPTIYDPYRNNNILKDSNRPIENWTRPTHKTFYQNVLNKKHQAEFNKKSENNRHSLKKLLERLQSLPSPDRKTKKTQNPKLKTISIMSSTEPVIIKKKGSILVRNYIQDAPAEASKEKASFKATKTSFLSTPKTKIRRANEEETKVRRLIKKKLAEKQELKQKNKTEKLINFLRQNNFSQISKKSQTNNARLNSRKLINFLC